MEKFIQKKKEIQEPGNTDDVENLVSDENAEESVDKLELQYATGEWYKAPNDSGNFGNLFKPIFKGVDKIMNFQEGIPTAFQKKENITPFMEIGVKIKFLSKLENWPDGVSNVRVNLRASVK